MTLWLVDGVADGACRVEDALGQHVGTLKWIHGVWKFKAIGHEASGAVIPGGGPLTDSHNTVVPSHNPIVVNRALGGAISRLSTHHDLANVVRK